MLQQVMRDTLPDAVELVTPPLRAAGSTDVQAPGTPLAAAAAAAGASLAGGQPRPPYSLREGVGMRRLVKFRVQAGVQLLLVQAASEVYAQHYHHMAVSVVVQHCSGVELVQQLAWLGGHCHVYVQCVVSCWWGCCLAATHHLRSVAEGRPIILRALASQSSGAQRRHQRITSHSVTVA